MRPLIALLLLSACQPDASPPLVMAAVSTSDAMQTLSERFHVSDGGEVRLAFGASSDLARQLNAGARGEVFLSADSYQLDAVGPLVMASKELLSNSLVVIVPRDASLIPASADDLAKIDKLALASPDAVPAGAYAKAWLEKRGAWQAVAPHVVPALDVRAALAAVASGGCQAGVVYRTDAARSSEVRVAFTVPPAETPPIVYPAALLKGSSDVARRFYDFLSSAEARDVWTAQGFTVLAP